MRLKFQYKHLYLLMAFLMLSISSFAQYAKIVDVTFTSNQKSNYLREYTKGDERVIICDSKGTSAWSSSSDGSRLYFDSEAKGLTVTSLNSEIAKVEFLIAGNIGNQMDITPIFLMSESKLSNIFNANPVPCVNYDKSKKEFLSKETRKWVSYDIEGEGYHSVSIWKKVKALAESVGQVEQLGDGVNSFCIWGVRVYVRCNSATITDYKNFTNEERNALGGSDACKPLSFNATANNGGSLTYQWFNDYAYDYDENFEEIEKETSNLYSGTTGSFVYRADVYESYGNGNVCVTSTKKSDTISVISNMYVSQDLYVKNEYIGNTYTISAYTTKVTDATAGKYYRYQWYAAPSEDPLVLGTPIDGATSLSYDIATNAIGTYYYYFVISEVDVNGNLICEERSKTIKIVVQEKSPELTVNQQDCFSIDLKTDLQDTDHYIFRCFETNFLDGEEIADVPAGKDSSDPMNWWSIGENSTVTNVMNNYACEGCAIVEPGGAADGFALMNKAKLWNTSNYKMIGSTQPRVHDNTVPMQGSYLDIRLEHVDSIRVFYSGYLAIYVDYGEGEGFQNLITTGTAVHSTTNATSWLPVSDTYHNHPVTIRLYNQHVTGTLFIKNILYKYRNFQDVELKFPNVADLENINDQILESNLLKPNTLYNIAAKAVNTSNAETEWTKDGWTEMYEYITPPSPVVDVETSNIGATCFQINWNHPDFIGTEDYEYVVEVFADELCQGRVGGEIIVEKSFNYCLVNNLSPNTDYWYRVKVRRKPNTERFPEDKGCESSFEVIKTTTLEKTCEVKISIIFEGSTQSVECESAYVSYMGRKYCDGSTLILGENEKIDLSLVEDFQAADQNFCRWIVGGISSFEEHYITDKLCEYGFDKIVVTIGDKTDLDVESPVFKGYINVADQTLGSFCNQQNVYADQELYFQSTEPLYKVENGQMSSILTNADIDYIKQQIIFEKVKDEEYIIVPAEEYTSEIKILTEKGGVVELRILPKSTWDYQTQYRITFIGEKMADKSGNTLKHNTCIFRISAADTRLILMKDVNEKLYSNGVMTSMGSLWGDTKELVSTYSICNKGNANLNISNWNLMESGANGFSIVSNTIKSTIAPGECCDITFKFDGTSQGHGLHSTTFYVESDDNNGNERFELILSAFVGGFSLPYTYLSGCQDPIMSESEIVQDYASLQDIPVEVEIAGAKPENNKYYYATYYAYQSEGSCVLNGNSALRVGNNKGSKDERLKIVVNETIGEFSIRWSANGHRSLTITDENGSIYLQTKMLEGRVCHTNSVVINSCSDPNRTSTTLYVSFEGADVDALTTVSYFNIKKCDLSKKSSACDITDFKLKDDPDAEVKIYDDVIFVQSNKLSCQNGVYKSPIKADLSTSPGATTTPVSGGVVSPTEIKSEILEDYTSSFYKYIVTAADGMTKKTYQVYVSCVDNSADCYKNEIQIPVKMSDATDKTLKVHQLQNASCSVDIAGKGSEHTIHFITKENIPLGGYKINGPSQVCIGSVATYTLASVPASNNPVYRWTIEKNNAAGFVMLDGKDEQINGKEYWVYEGRALRLRAPIAMSATNLSLSILLDFSDAKCVQLTGSAEKTIRATDKPPTKVSEIIADCVGADGKLLLTAVQDSTDADNFVEATTMGWTFTPNYLNDRVELVSNDVNSIRLNIGTQEAPAILAQVVVQNGCGIGSDTETLPVNYAAYETEWIAGNKPNGDEDWFNHENWTNRVPGYCTNVIIRDVVPQSSANLSSNACYYPTIENGKVGQCNYITFRPGAGILGIENLQYKRAFVELEMVRNKWYTLTPPLKDFYSGDFNFMGSPVSYIRLFDEINPDKLYNGTYVEGDWSGAITKLDYKIESNKGFVSMIDEKTNNYPNPATKDESNKKIVFPRMTTDSSLVTLLHPYTAAGRVVTQINVNLPRTEKAYRFAAENEQGKIQSQQIAVKQGLNLIGNPYMSHLSIKRVLAKNAGILQDRVAMWNGVNYSSYYSAKDIFEDASYSSGYLTGQRDVALISPMQSFLVFAENAGTITIDSNCCSADISGDYNLKEEENVVSSLRSASTVDVLPILEICVDDGKNKTFAAVMQSDKASNGFSKEDGVKIFSPMDDVVEVYSILDNKYLDLNIFSSTPFIVPLGFKSARENVQATISFVGVDNFYNVDVYLVNTLTGEEINLKEERVYQHFISSSVEEGVLQLEFRQGENVSTKVKDTENADVQIYTTNNEIKVVSSSDNLIQEVKVYDETGRLVVVKNGINSNRTSILMNTLLKVYVVKVTTDYGVKVSKVLIR